MKKISSFFVGGISILPALLVMPAMADPVEVSTWNDFKDNSDVILTGNITGDTTHSFGIKTVDLNNHNLVIHGVSSGWGSANDVDLCLSNGSIELSGVSNTNGAMLIASRNNHYATITTTNMTNIKINNNIGTSMGGGLYHENEKYATDTTYISELNAANIEFKNNTAQLNNGAAILSTTGELHVLGDTNTFEGNQRVQTESNAAKLYKRGGGAIANQAGGTADTVMVIGKATSTNSFAENTSATNGGAIMNRAVRRYKLDGSEGFEDDDKDAYFTINGTSTFEQNIAAENGGAIYNVGLDDVQDAVVKRIAQVNINGSSEFTLNSAKNGGAIYNTSNATLNINNGENISYTDSFSENTATANGGAIYNNGTLTLNNATFSENSSTGTDTFIIDNYTLGGQGGAIFNGNDGNITVNGTTAFSDNTAGSSGGAIDNLHATMAFNGAATFTDNTVTGGDGQGGAIRNKSGTITFNNGVTFTGNSSSVSGSAIYNGTNHLVGGVININGDSVFQSNTGSYAIHNVSNSNTESHDLIAFADGNATFKNNVNGALWNQDVMTFTNMGTVLFQGNTIDTNSSAAISNVGSLTINAETFTVTGNQYTGTNKLGAAVGNTAAGSMFDLTATNVNFISNTGGAIYKENDSFTITADKMNFAGNTGANAAAINNNGNYSQTTLNGGEIYFSGNIDSATYGGAIFNSGDYVKILGDKVTFSGNRANGTTTTEGDIVKYGGGAISNRGNSGSHQVTEVTIGKNANSVVKFNNNYSAMNGGAIHARAEKAADAGTVMVNGATTFDTNIAELNGGAVSNSPVLGTSTITFNGNTVLKNNQSRTGLGGALYNTGTVTFVNNATFTGNTDSTGANDVHNDGNINFAGTTTMTGGITGSGNLNIANGASLDLGDTAKIVQDTIVLNGTMIAALNPNDDYRITANTFTGDGNLALTFQQEGTYKVFGNATFDNVIVNDDSNMFSPIYNLTWVNNGKSLEAAHKTVDEIVADNNISSDAANVVNALATSDNNIAQQISLITQDALARGDTEYVEQESAKLNPEKAPVTTSVALSLQNQVLTAAGERMSLALTGRSGGDIKADLGLWAKGMYNSTKHKDVFSGHTWGGSIGFDTDLNHSVILGVGYSFGDTNVDLHSHDVDIDSNTIFVYGQYRNSDWFVNGTIAYTMAKYDWNKSAFGLNLSPSYHVNSLSEQIMGGYHFDNGITPTLGLRYLDVHSDSYNNGLARVAATDSTYLTGVAGVDYKYVWIAPNTSVFWNPELHIAATYDMVSDSDVAVVMIPGAAAYAVETENLSRLGGEFGVGLTAEYYYLTVSLNYDLNVHKDYTSHTGSLKLKYKF